MRSVWKPPHVVNLSRRRIRSQGRSKRIILYSRRALFSPATVGRTLSVHTGRSFHTFESRPHHVGQVLAHFALTKRLGPDIHRLAKRKIAPKKRR